MRFALPQVEVINSRSDYTKLHEDRLYNIIANFGRWQDGGMLSLLATPSPVPIVINMPESGSPWWGVPVIAGAFLLVGASLAFLSTLASDKRKAKRDTAERIMLDTRAVGLEYIDAATEMASVVSTQQDPSRALEGGLYLKALSDALLNVQRVWGKFELFGHDDALVTGRNLFTACIVVLIPPETEQGMKDNLASFEAAKLDFINTLRRASGVGEIESKEPPAAEREQFIADRDGLLDEISLRLATQYEKSQEQ